MRRFIATTTDINFETIMKDVGFAVLPLFHQVSLDVHKNSISAALADAGRNADVRNYGIIGGGLNLDRLLIVT